MKHGEVEVGEGQLGEIHIPSPTGISTKTGSRLLFLIALTILEVLAVLETHVSPPHQE